MEKMSNKGVRKFCFDTKTFGAKGVKKIFSGIDKYFRLRYNKKMYFWNFNPNKIGGYIWNSRTKTFLNILANTCLTI